ncbi:MAG: mechanosensitive ion channel family protein [Mycobacteriales bacterium]
MTVAVSQRVFELATTPLRILIIIVIALVARMLLHRAIKRLVRSASADKVPVLLQPLRDRTRGTLLDTGPLLSERRRQRAETIGSVLRSIVSAFVLSVAFAMILAELDFNLAPVIASAGIVGVAVGFGAQNLIKDFLNGMFMILEDQYGVGDVIDAGEATGTVEAVGLRATRLRDVQGTVWHVRNGEIARIGNKSQGWARALLDIPVTWETDVETARTTMKAAADSMWSELPWSAKILEEPSVWGVEELGSSGVVLRLAVKTAPLAQWEVARELRERVKAAFDANGIALGVPLSDLRGSPPGAVPPPGVGEA